MLIGANVYNIWDTTLDYLKFALSRSVSHGGQFTWRPPDFSQSECGY